MIKPPRRTDTNLVAEYRLVPHAGLKRDASRG
jgi:hypothetical protein